MASLKVTQSDDLQDAQSQASIFGEPPGLSDTDLEPIPLSSHLKRAQSVSSDGSWGSFDSEPLGSDPEDLERPNKRQRTVAQWRQEHQSEIHLSASLDQLRNQDLGVHLYNVFKLREHAEAFPLEKPRRGHLEPKTMKLPPSWTAWPLAAEDVPRESETIPRSWQVSQHRPWTVLSADQPKSSRQVAEEITIALAAKKARERFQSREWEDNADNYEPVYTIPANLRKGTSRKAAKKKDAEKSASDEGDASDSENSAPHDEGSPNSDGIKHPFIGIEPPKEEFLVETARLVPAPLSDEEHITSLLQRPARHLLSQLDALLAAMHYSKISKYRPIQKQYRGWDSDENEEENAKDPSEAQGLDTLNSTRERASAKGPSSRKPIFARNVDRYGHHRYAHGYGLRDWSSLLGFASLAGWPAAAVQRARGRCEALFEQRMDFVSSIGAGGAVSSDEERETRDPHKSSRGLHTDLAPGTARVIAESDPGILGSPPADPMLPSWKREIERVEGGVHMDWSITPIEWPLPKIPRNSRQRGKTVAEFRMGPDWQGPVRKPGWYRGPGWRTEEDRKVNREIRQGKKEKKQRRRERARIKAEEASNSRNTAQQVKGGEDGTMTKVEADEDSDMGQE